jgi:hypothetical protein
MELISNMRADRIVSRGLEQAFSPDALPTGPRRMRGRRESQVPHCDRLGSNQSRGALTSDIPNSRIPSQHVKHALPFRGPVSTGEVFMPGNTARPHLSRPARMASRGLQREWADAAPRCRRTQGIGGASHQGGATDLHHAGLHASMTIMFRYPARGRQRT